MFTERTFRSVVWFALVAAAVLLGGTCESGSSGGNGGDGGTPPSTPATVAVFLDITSRVASSSGGGELGLLGLAFDPGYAANGLFYVNYTTGGGGSRSTRVSRFSVSAADRNRADPASETVLLEFSQPFDNHNGGQLAFGPDGYLYIATGDGGFGGDPMDNAQNLSNLLGKILRLDVHRAAVPYGIPPDNPFASNSSGFRPEIFAYGLRNPWRFSFDPPTGRIWAGDVGQASWEEIDLIVRGGNYGWDCREGAHVYTGPVGGPAAACAGPLNLVEPVWEYGHTGGNISVTGGYVYRGASASSLTGAYIYADFGSGRIWALRYDGSSPGSNTLVVDAPFGISSFGRDRDGELLVLQYDAAGGLYRIDQTSTGSGAFSYSLTRVYDTYSPALATDLQQPGDGTNRLFILEQAGVIRVLTPGT